jgi:DNA-binding transcriptional regulator YdaS (Cro superfamily)
MFSEFIRTSGQNRSAWADRLGVSRSYLSDLLNGNKTPSLELAVQIERATGGAVPASSWIPTAKPDRPADGQEVAA